MKKRNLKYEQNFRKYLFSFDLKNHLEILKSINASYLLVKEKVKGGES